MDASGLWWAHLVLCSPVCGPDAKNNKLAKPSKTLIKPYLEVHTNMEPLAKSEYVS